jgi:hypothetical protein
LFGTTGQNNAFFGTNSGLDNTTGSNNSFFGSTAGDNNITGSSNSVFGFSAGGSNLFGSGNSYFGADSNSTDGLSNSTAIGSRAFVTQSNSLILGSINGTNGATTDTNVGIGTTAPARRLHVSNGVSGAVSISTSEVVIEDDAAAFQHFITPDDVESGVLFGDPTVSIAGGIIFNNAATNNGMLFRSGGNTTRMTLNGSGQLGIGVSPADTLDVNGIVRVATLGAAGATHICRNASNQLSTCTSLAERAGSEELSAPRAEIEAQRKEIEYLRVQVDALKKLACATNAEADICKPRD